MLISTWIRRSCALLFLLSFGCAAQAPSPDLNRNIERNLRSYYSVPADVKLFVGARTPSDFSGYDNLVVTFDNGQKKQDQKFLISKDNKTLLRVTRFDLTQDPYASTMKKIDLAGRPVRGNENAKVTIVNYDDFECPFCARMHETLTNDILKNYGDRVRIIYKDYPLTEIHPWAKHAAIDANCLAAQSGQAYWDFADYMHDNQQQIAHQAKSLLEQENNIDRIALDQAQKAKIPADTIQACIKAQSDKQVQASMEEADKLGVSATPTLFINGYKIDGAIPAEELHAAIDNALRDAGVTTAAATSH
ncbi:MAG TPA: thioredoxin domain-containing protein [Terriglobales bacterium]|nr:thioredoxin domain-containing protein [Terriglobales bacterium]